MELTSEDKAAINESTGILYDTGSSAKERAAAQAELTSIFKRVGQDARDYQSSSPRRSRSQSVSRVQSV